jgi:hypothetical protein
VLPELEDRQGDGLAGQSLDVVVIDVVRSGADGITSPCALGEHLAGDDPRMGHRQPVRRELLDEQVVAGADPRHEVSDGELTEAEQDERTQRAAEHLQRRLADGELYEALVKANFEGVGSPGSSGSSLLESKASPLSGRWIDRQRSTFASPAPQLYVHSPRGRYSIFKIFWRSVSPGQSLLHRSCHLGA